MISSHLHGGEEKQAQVTDEKEARKRFWQSYTSATRPLLKADAVYMLRGLKDPDSLRVIAGLLGDGTMEVRRNACRVMADTPDPDGYFVKPLIGALIDKEPAVRVEAVRALARAKVKAKAIKALVFAFQETLGKEGDGSEFLDAVHETLMKLTGKTFGKGAEPRKQVWFWQKYWQENRKQLEAADQTYLAKRKATVERK